MKEECVEGDMQWALLLALLPVIALMVVASRDDSYDEDETRLLVDALAAARRRVRSLDDVSDLSPSFFEALQKSKKSFDDSIKRSVQLLGSSYVPRGGLLVSGRGYGPGFFDHPRFLRKRSIPVFVPQDYL